MNFTVPGYLGRKLPLTVLCALLLGVAAFLVGCGGDDEPATTGDTTAASVTEATTEETAEEAAEEAEETDEADANDEGSDAAAGESKSKGDGGKSKGEGKKDGGKVVVPPNRHKDSGGGSKQFRVKGGDNSIQDSGKEADDATFAEVAAVAHAFLDARAAGDNEMTCRLLSSNIKRELEQLASQAPEAPKDCEGLIEAFTGGIPAKVRRTIAKADIGSVRVNGDSAFVLYWGHEKETYILPMAREDGQWRAAAIAGSVLP